MDVQSRTTSRAAAGTGAAYILFTFCMLLCVMGMLGLMGLLAVSLRGALVVMIVTGLVLGLLLDWVLGGRMLGIGTRIAAWLGMALLWPAVVVGLLALSTFVYEPAFVLSFVMLPVFPILWMAVLARTATPRRRDAGRPLTSPA